MSMEPETVIDTAAVSVLLPWMVTLVGPSSEPAVKVTVQVPPAGSDSPQVLPETDSPLPPGMVAPILAAAFDPVLVMVTKPVPPVAIVRVDAEIPSVVVVLGAVTVNCTDVAGVLLPAKLMAVGPSGVAPVSVIVQLAPAASDEPQVLADTEMPLPAGIVA